MLSTLQNSQAFPLFTACSSEVIYVTNGNQFLQVLSLYEMFIYEIFIIESGIQAVLLTRE